MYQGLKFHRFPMPHVKYCHILLFSNDTDAPKVLDARLVDYIFSNEIRLLLLAISHFDSFD